MDPLSTWWRARTTTTRAATSSTRRSTVVSPGRRATCRSSPSAGPEAIPSPCSSRRAVTSCTRRSTTSSATTGRPRRVTWSCRYWTDGGVNWATPVVVYQGHGADKDPTQVFNDKDWMVADTNPNSPHYGRVYLTWSRFPLTRWCGRGISDRESHSDDGGITWSTAHEISGNAAFCTFQTDGPAGQCDEDQFSVGAITADGTVYVAFETARTRQSGRRARRRRAATWS